MAETATPALSYPFEAATPLQRRMAHGHLIRTGHPLVGRYESDGEIYHLTRTCCADN